MNAPSFSCASGFYQREFDLEIFSDEGSSIYYTLDGSAPDEQSILYQNPIHVYDRSGEANIYNMVQNTTYDWKDNNKIISESVPKAFVIRAMSIDENGRKSDVVTATYFVNQEVFKDGIVLSLNANPDDLFGETEGLLVTGAAYDKWYLNKQIGTRPIPNFMQSGDDWERPVCVELFKAGSPIMTQNVGMRVQGASTREEHKKRMRLIARKKYSGANQFATQIFGENKSGTWLLRGSYEDIFCRI